MHHLLFFFNDTATTEIYTLSLHDALPISDGRRRLYPVARPDVRLAGHPPAHRSVDSDPPAALLHRHRCLAPVLRPRGAAGNRRYADRAVSRALPLPGLHGDAWNLRCARPDC